jgi:nitroreductase
VNLKNRLILKYYYYLYVVAFRLKLPVKNDLYMKYILVQIKAMPSDELCFLLGDKSHKLLQQSLGQKIEGNEQTLLAILEELENRSFNNEIIDWAKDIFKKYKNGTLQSSDDSLTVHNSNPMNCLLGRQSVRSYFPDQVPKDDIDKILFAAINAPSSCNRQSWRFAVFEKHDDKKFIASIRKVKFIENAPLVVMVMVNKSVYRNKIEREITSIMDGSAAIMNILHSAYILGYGSCWVNFLASVSKKNMKLFRERYNIPQEYSLVSLVTIGKATRFVTKPKRLEVSSYATYF